MKLQFAIPSTGFEGAQELPAAGKQVLEIDLNASKYLADHCVQGTPVLPGASFIEAVLLVMSGSYESRVSRPLKSLSNITFQRPLLLDDVVDGAIRLSVRISDDKQDLVVEPADIATPHPYMSCSFLDKTSPATGENIEPVQQRCNQSMKGSQLYRRLQENGNDYRSAFHSIQQWNANEEEVLAKIELADEFVTDESEYILHPVLLDACFQAVIAGQVDLGAPFIVMGLETFAIHDAPTKNAWVYAKLTCLDEAAGRYGGDVKLLNDSGGVVAVIEGVQIQKLIDTADTATDTATSTQNLQVAIAANFTAEPVAPSVAFWMEKWGMPANPEFAPYNQPFQQLLDPNSLLSTNNSGFNVILIRFAEWLGNRRSVFSGIDERLKEELVDGRETYTLPNRAEVAHLNPYESEYLYKEIFLDKAYLRHGIQIQDGDCVIDVGANIGMFTLFVLDQAEDAKIYSFEPSPAAYQALQTNASLYGTSVKTFQCGLSDKDGEAPFTFYKHSSVFSSYHPDVDDDHKAVKTVVENALHQIGKADNVSVADLTENMMADRMESETFLCPIRRLSSIVDEEGIEQIDLLKVDVEKSERQVLAGIDDRHWSMIKQIVLEVHDTVGDVVEEITTMLTARGFELAIEEEDLLEKSGLYNIYGTRIGKKDASAVGDSEGEHLRRNVNEFLEALSIFDTRTSIPTIVALCPSSDSNEDDELYGEATAMLGAGMERWSNIHLLTHDEVISRYPVEEIFDADADKLGHVPYSESYFTALGTSLVRKQQALYRKPFKVVVLDCDQTLWRGVCGEEGPDGIGIDGPWAQLQSFMTAQHDRGMLLCLCSKNSEEDVLNVFNSRQDMRLKLDHVVAHKINWLPKSQNIQALADELQLGLDSFIFVDDNPVECAEVQARCPEVLVLQLPADPEEIPGFLLHQWAFDKSDITKEDGERTRLYQQNVARERFRASGLTFAAFIAALNLEVVISAPQASELARLAQLTHRTNQFNITTYRRSEGDVRDALHSGALQAKIVRVKDRFGDYGIVGAVLFATDPDALIVDTLLLSCRVLGKGVEYDIMRHVGNEAVGTGKSSVVVPFIPSRKNAPAAAFLESISTSVEKESLQHDYFLNTPIQSDNPIGSGIQFVIDAAMLVDLKFEPADGLAESESREEMDGARSAASVGHEGSRYVKVATSYSNVSQIMEALASTSRRKRSSLPGVYVAPQDDIERIIAEIWAKILLMDYVGVTDHFFELGGTSLKAVQAISRIKEALQTEIAAVSLFDKTTVRDIAAMIRNTNAAMPETASDVRERGKKRREMRARRRRG